MSNCVEIVIVVAMNKNTTHILIVFSSISLGSSKLQNLLNAEIVKLVKLLSYYQQPVISTVYNKALM